MTDYKKTVILPSTSFPMRRVEHEDAIRKIWDLGKTYEHVSYKFQKSPYAKFVLHDGPPYANGNIHMGHALNKILKDLIVRSRYVLDEAVSFTPGWDCHGLPIESQVEKNLIAEGKNKSDLTVKEFRQLCREYAKGWVETQKEQFKLLGINADWDNPYLTMDFETESTIAETLLAIADNNLLYQAYKPVLWSPLEETSLAEAEVEYKDLKTSQAWVAFPLRGLSEPVSVLIWTTTPWTIPANLALAYNPDFTYVIVEVKSSTNDLIEAGRKFVIAESRLEETSRALGFETTEDHKVFDLKDTKCLHPLWEDGYEGDRALLAADFVTDDAGTGIVHIAPEHGPEDFQLWQKHNMGDFRETLGSRGEYLDHVPLFAGETVLNPTPKGEYIFEFTNAKVTRALAVRGNLLHTVKVTTSQSHSWRSHTPLIYRATQQWFINLSDNPVDTPFSVKNDVLEDLTGVKFIPEKGRNRLEAAVGGRPDWLISRQRVWGTPVCLFTYKDTGELLVNEVVNSNIIQTFDEFGGDAWWDLDVSHWFQGSDLNPNDFNQVKDVLDVWFDSGCSSKFIQNNLHQTSSVMYVEGSDQHRGWFQSSALVSASLGEHIAFDTILTHGFVLDKNGEKMSKSKGNVVDPLVKAQQFGTDVLRYWVATSDYTNDLRVSDEILKTADEAYRKVRNTLRFMISAVDEFDGDREDHEIDDLDRYIMDRCYSVVQEVKASYSNFDFKGAVAILAEFQNKELSSMYLDAKKDILYCDRPDSPRRRGCQYVIEDMLYQLLTLWTPVIPYTVEEIWQTIDPGFVGTMTKSPGLLSSGKLNGVDSNLLWKVVDLMNTKVEEERRREGGIQNLMDMKVTLGLQDISDWSDNLDLAMLLKVSQAEIIQSEGEEVTLTISRAEGQKCARSRKVLPEVGSDPEYPDLTLRDADAVRFWKTQNP